MKEGYKIYDSFNYKWDNFIEVINDFFSNEVLHYGWASRNGYDMSKDENTVGVWKVKYKN